MLAPLLRSTLLVYMNFQILSTMMMPEKLSIHRNIQSISLSSLLSLLTSCWLSILPLFHPFIYPFMQPSIVPNIHLSNQLSISSLIYSSIHQFIHLTSQWFIWQIKGLFIHLYICPFIHPPILPSISTFIILSKHSSNHASI